MTPLSGGAAALYARGMIHLPRMPAFLLAPVLPLAFIAGCSGEKEPGPIAVGLEHIDCAVGGAAALTPACSVERVEKEGRLTLVVHHPDGGSRRFLVKQDGTGVTAIDSAVSATVKLIGGRLNVTVGADRYLFPATVTPGAASEAADD